MTEHDQGSPEAPENLEIGMRAGFRGAGRRTPATACEERTGDRIGRYKLLQSIGEGGMGSVWMAEQLEPVRRKVALKVIKVGMDSKQVVARFEAERQALALMDHPNIAKILDGGTTDRGRPYFVMELVKGVPITEFCDTSRLDVSQRLELFRHVCSAVQHAHQKGVIHRDVKPSNVFVTLHDGVPVPKVIDFGIAKATSAELTQKTLFTEYRQLIGTPEYMAPEQAEMSGLDIDTRADVYSLGVLLYELLTGSTPFDMKAALSQGFGELLRTIREEEPQRPSTRTSAVDETTTRIAMQRGVEPGKLSGVLRGDLDWIVLRALEKDRGRRYETADAMGVDIGRYLSGEPVSAVPPSLAYRLRKFARRHRGAVVAAAIFVAVLLLGIAGTTWGLIRALDAESVAGIRREESEARARAERRLAQRLRAEALAAAAAESVDADPQLAMLLARDSIRVEQTARGVSSLYRALAMSHEQNVLRGHAGGVLNASYSPDGTRILTTGRDRTARLWDQSGTQLAVLRTAAAHVDAVFSPDGTRVATTPASYQGGTVQIWTSAGEHVADLDEHDTPVRAIFSPDGRGLLTAAWDGTVRLWDHQGKQLHAFRKIPSGTQDASFSRDGSRVLLADRKGVVRVFDLSAAELASFRVPETTLQVRFTPDGARIVTAGRSGVVRILDLDGTERRVVRAHAAWINALVFSPDGSSFVTVSRDRTGARWDLDGNRLATLAGHGDGWAKGFSGAAFSPDGSRIVTCGHRTARIWSLEGTQRVVLRGHADFVGSAVFSPDGSTVLTASSDGTARLWRLTGEGLPIPRAHKAPIKAVAYSPDGSFLATAAFPVGRSPKEKGTVHLWTGDGRRRIATLAGHERAVQDLVFAPDGRRFATASFDDTARIWSVAGESLAVLRHAGVNRVRFSPDGSTVLTASSSGVVRLWGLDGTERLTIGEGEEGRARLSQDGRRILVASGDRTMRLLDWAGEERLVVHRPSKGGEWFCSAPDGSRFLTTQGGRMFVWDRSGRTVAEVEGHQGQITSCRFSADGTKILTASTDRTARLWSLDDGEVVVMRGHEDLVSYARFTADGTQILTAGYDGMVRWWDLEGRELGSVGTAGGILRFALSPDGARIAVGYGNGTLAIWPIHLDDAMRLAQRRLTRDYTAGEREQYAALLGAAAKL